MNLTWAATGAFAGVPLGIMLRDPVFRLSVPAGAPDRSACPACGTPVGGWLAIRCAYCRRILGPPVMLELVMATVLALLAGRFAGQADLLPFAYFGALGVTLAAIDLAVQRLPDRLTLPAFPLLIALLAVGAFTEHTGTALLRAVLGGLSLAGAYLLLAVARPGQLGGGDVKLAGLAGLVLGWLGWPTLIFGACLGFLLAGMVSVVLLAARRVTLRTSISFGPYLFGGALLAILSGHGL